MACCPGAQSGSKFWLRCIGGIPPPSPAVNGGILFGFGAHMTPTFAAHVVFCTKFLSIYSPRYIGVEAGLGEGVGDG